MGENQKRVKKKKNNSKGNKKLKVTLIVIGVLLVLGITAFLGARLYVKSKFDKVQHVSIPQDNKSLGIASNSDNDISNISNITNILLLGTDSREANNDAGNSDSMMVLTIDKKSNKLKITSIMRDSIVNVDGYGQRKLTEAHNIGGPLLTIKTINENYNLDIRDYVQVNFVGLSKIIDYIGGVPINVTAGEISSNPHAINSYIDEISKIEKVTPQHVTRPGLQTLNGIQAVAYSRIRYIGNNDFQRTERQRTVLSQIFKKLSTTHIADIGGVADTIAPYVQTTLKSDDMLSMATYILTHNMTDFEQNRVPYDGMYSDQKVNGEDGLAWNKQTTIDKLHQFIYDTTAK